MPPMHRSRFGILGLAGLVLAAACGDNGPGGSPRVVVAPILDSLFVGDTLAARTARYFDASGDSQATGPVRWFGSAPSVFTVDSVSGVLVGVGRGAAVLSARANGINGTALLVVSRVLDLSLLLDTVYLMPGDTFTVPYSVRSRNGSPPPVLFTPVSSGVVTIDSTGQITAIAASGLVSFTAHADSVSASGAVEVVALTDTVGGKSYFTILGTAIERTRAGARAVNYRRAGDQPAFRLSTPVVVQGQTVENFVITDPSPIVVGVGLLIGAISPGEAFGPGTDPICRPPGMWALWTTQAVVPTLHGYSRNGVLTINRMVSIPHGLAISGRFTVTAQRGDLYDDPLGALPIRGTFVAPLITDNRATCGS